MNSARKDPVIMASEESESTEGIKELLFGVMKETADLRVPQDETDCPFLALFGDESQPTYNKASTKHCHPFVNQNTAPVFLIDPGDRNQMTNRNCTYNSGEAHPAIHARKNSVDRHRKGLLTAPEQVLRENNSAPFANYKRNSLHKTHLQGCHDGQLYLISPGSKEKPSTSEKSGECQQVQDGHSVFHSPFSCLMLLFFNKQMCVCPDPKLNQINLCIAAMQF